MTGPGDGEVPGPGDGTDNGKGPGNENGEIFEGTEPQVGVDMAYDITGRGRIVPETRQEVMRDLYGFVPEYADLMRAFGEPIAGATGENIGVFTQQVGPSILDAAEMFTDRRASGIADVLGIEGDLTASEAADAAARINPIIASMLEGAQSIDPLLQRMESEALAGLTPRQERQIRQTERAYSGAAGRGMGTSAIANEAIAAILGEKTNLGQDVNNILDARTRQAAIGAQVSDLQQPFVGTALGVGDIATGMDFASGITGMAFDAVPTASDLFTLQAQERDFALQQEALDQAAKAGDFNAVTTILSGLRSAQKMGFIPGSEAIQNAYSGVGSAVLKALGIG